MAKSAERGGRVVSGKNLAKERPEPIDERTLSDEEIAAFDTYANKKAEVKAYTVGRKLRSSLNEVQQREMQQDEKTKAIEAGFEKLKRTPKIRKQIEELELKKRTINTRAERAQLNAQIKELETHLPKIKIASREKPVVEESPVQKQEEVPHVQESRETEAQSREVEELRELAQEHAIAEPEPNSHAERKAKIEAMLAKYGPESRRSRIEAEVTPESDPVESAPTFNSSTVDFETAALAYQTGHLDGQTHVVESASQAEVDPSTIDLAEAARIYQTGDMTSTASRALHARTEKSTAKREANAAFRAQNESLLAEEKQRQEFYFAALRRSQKGRGFWDAVGERSGFGKARNDDPTGQVAALRRGWVEKRAARAKLMLDSIDARRAGRGGDARQARDSEKVRARYQRMFVVREVVLGAEEAEQKVRIDALRSRDKNVVEAVWKGYSKLSPRQKQLFGVATAATAGTTAALVGGLPALITVLAMSGAGAALNTVSLMSKEGSKTQKTASNIAKFVTFGGLGGMLGRMFARGTNKNKLQRAEQKLGERKYNDLRNTDAFETLSRERRDAAQDKDRVSNRVTTVGAASALAASAAGGALVGGAVRGLEHNSDGGSHITEGGTGGGSHGAEVQHNGHEISARIEHRGEGADKLYADLREKISEAYRRAGERPPVVQEILKYRNMDEFSRATGFETIVKGADAHASAGHIDSAVMHMEGDGFKADTFTLSADAKTLSYIDSKGATHVLMQETPQHEVAVQSQQDGWIPMRNYRPHPEAGRVSAPAPEAKPVLGDAAGDAKIAGLNKSQLTGTARVEVPSPTPAAPSERLYRSLDELPDRFGTNTI